MYLITSKVECLSKRLAGCLFTFLLGKTSLCILCLISPFLGVRGIFFIIYLFVYFDFLHILQNYLPFCNDYLKIFLSLKLLNLITEYLGNGKEEKSSIS